MDFGIVLKGHVLNRPVDAKAGEGPIWLPIGSNIVRVPIFRYSLFSDDQDYLAAMGMTMMLDLIEREKQHALYEVRQRILIRRSVPHLRQLYQGVISVL